MSAARGVAAAARAAARSKAVRAVAVSAGGAAVQRAGPVAQERYAAWRDRRVRRDRAVALARQMGGRVSEDTIIAGEPHVIVWKDGVPVQAFPHVEELAGRPELAGFDARLAYAPPAPRERRRRLRR